MTRFRSGTRAPDNAAVSFRLCLFSALALVAVGFLFNSPAEILRGLYSYVLCSDILVTDYFVIGSTGAAFVNAGLVMLVSIGLTILIKTPYNGATIAMLYLMGGFSLFGKNPINILPFFLGVWLYSKVRGIPMARYTNAALFSTALTPIVSDLLLNAPAPLPVRLLLAPAAGAAIGYIIIPLAEHSFSTHMGYTLFNYGFAGGLIALVLSSVVGAMGHPIAPRSIWQTGVQPGVLALLLGLVGVLMSAGLWLCGWTAVPYLRIMRHAGRAPTDFVITDGIGPTLVNMGTVGLMSIGYILLVGGDLNGPVAGAILTSIGFGAAGEHPRNTAPVMLGVYLASLVMLPPTADPGFQLAALFGTALAPIAGQFGWFYGVIAGFLHAAVVQVVGVPCGGYNLYNNGFSAGLVALVMVALIQSFSRRWRESDR